MTYPFRLFLLSTSCIKTPKTINRKADFSNSRLCLQHNLHDVQHNLHDVEEYILGTEYGW